MTLQEKIKSEPYLKVSNCTDVSDLNYAISVLTKLDAEFGEDNQTLLNIWAKVLDKKKKLEATASTSNCEHHATITNSEYGQCCNCGVKFDTGSNMHPIFQQALAPFGIK